MASKRWVSRTASCPRSSRPRSTRVPRYLIAPPPQVATGRSGRRSLRRGGRRRPRARTGAGLLVAACAREEAETHEQRRRAMSTHGAAPYSLRPFCWHVDCPPGPACTSGSRLEGCGRISIFQPGTWTVGGGTDDGIRFPGLLPRLLELDLTEDRVWLRCTAPCPVGRAMLGPGRPPLAPSGRTRPALRAGLALGRGCRRGACHRGSRPLPARTRGRRSLRRAPAGMRGGPDAGRVFPLVGPVTEVGRLPGCAVQLGDGAVSRRHLQLVGEGGVHRVRDVGRRNRARCNGRWLRARKGVLLADGDLLEVGRSLLHYRAPDEEPPLTASETAPPAPPGAPSDAGAG